MAENDLDSGQSTGTAGSPNQPSSAGSGDQQSSFDAAKLQSTLEALGKRLDEVDARSKSLQGDKDRGVKQTKKEVEELKRQIAEIEKLKSSGLEPDDAVEEHLFREDVRGLREQLSKLNPVSPQAAGNGASGSEDVAKVVAKYELSETDPEVVEAMRGKTGDALEISLSNLALKRAKSTQPSAAAATAAQSGAVSTKDKSIEALTEDYQKDMLAAKRGDKTALTQIKDKYRKLGVPVDTVAFV